MVTRSGLQLHCLEHICLEHIAGYRPSQVKQHTRAFARKLLGACVLAIGLTGGSVAAAEPSEPAAQAQRRVRVIDDFVSSPLGLPPIGWTLFVGDEREAKAVAQAVRVVRNAEKNVLEIAPTSSKPVVLRRKIIGWRLDERKEPLRYLVWNVAGSAAAKLTIELVWEGTPSHADESHQQPRRKPKRLRYVFSPKSVRGAFWWPTDGSELQRELGPLREQAPAVAFASEATIVDVLADAVLLLDGRYVNARGKVVLPSPSFIEVRVEVDAASTASTDSATTLNGVGVARSIRLGAFRLQSAP